MKDIHPPHTNKSFHGSLERLLTVTFRMWCWLGFSWLPGDGGLCNHENHNIWFHVWSNPSVLKLLLSFFLPVTANKNGSPVISSTLTGALRQLVDKMTYCHEHTRRSMKGWTYSRSRKYSCYTEEKVRWLAGKQNSYNLLIISFNCRTYIIE